MKIMQTPPHLVILLFFFHWKTEAKLTAVTGIKNETITSLKNTTKSKNIYHPNNTSNMLRNTTNTVTTFVKMSPYTTKKTPLDTSQSMPKSQSTDTTPIRRTPSTCDCKDDKYKTGIMICAIIIAVLVLICAALIICAVALANKVSRLKTKLKQSKRQARSNGDFLSASSLLWSSGMDTWQKKVQTVNQTMDDISLAETNIGEEKHTLMTLPAVDKSKDNAGGGKPSNEETMTIISTLEL